MLEPLSWFPWNGSKRWMIPHIAKVFSQWDPAPTARYIEPFVGGGSVSHAMRQIHPTVPHLLGDANPWLVSLYQWQVLKKPYTLPTNFADVPYWRALKDSDIPNLSTEEQANRFAVCLLTAWGNRWETQADGVFRSTVNKKWVAPSYLATRLPQFFQASNLWLTPTDPMPVTTDWQVLAEQALAGDLLYLDPPYTETLGYGNQTWDLANQLDVVDLAIAKAKQGVLVVISNHASIERLYRRAGFKIQLIDSHTSSKTRRQRQEMLATYGLTETNFFDWT